jgi:uncharacterized protein YggL (DUF469 family)
VPADARETREGTMDATKRRQLVTINISEASRLIEDVQYRYGASAERGHEVLNDLINVVDRLTTAVALMAANATEKAIR